MGSCISHFSVLLLWFPFYLYSSGHEALTSIDEQYKQLMGQDIRTFMEHKNHVLKSMYAFVPTPVLTPMPVSGPMMSVSHPGYSPYNPNTPNNAPMHYHNTSVQVVGTAVPPASPHAQVVGPNPSANAVMMPNVAAPHMSNIKLPTE